jgi:hypothetical protein
MRPTMAASRARITTLRATYAEARLPPAILTTPEETRIHAGPYTLSCPFHRIQGNQGSAHSVLGLTTNGLAPWTACIRP